MKKYKEQGLVGYMDKERKKSAQPSPFGTSMDKIIENEKRRKR